MIGPGTGVRVYLACGVTDSPHEPLLGPRNGRDHSAWPEPEGERGYNPSGMSCATTPGAMVEVRASRENQSGQQRRCLILTFLGRRSALFFLYCSGSADRRQDPFLSVHALSSAGHAQSEVRGCRAEGLHADELILQSLGSRSLFP